MKTRNPENLAQHKINNLYETIQKKIDDIKLLTPENIPEGTPQKINTQLLTRCFGALGTIITYEFIEKTDTDTNSKFENDIIYITKKAETILDTYNKQETVQKTALEDITHIVDSPGVKKGSLIYNKTMELKGDALRNLNNYDEAIKSYKSIQINNADISYSLLINSKTWICYFMNDNQAEADSHLKTINKLKENIHLTDEDEQTKEILEFIESQTIVHDSAGSCFSSAASTPRSLDPLTPSYDLQATSSAPSKSKGPTRRELLLERIKHDKKEASSILHPYKQNETQIDLAWLKKLALIPDCSFSWRENNNNNKEPKTIPPLLQNQNAKNETTEDKPKDKRSSIAR